MKEELSEATITNSDNIEVCTASFTRDRTDRVVVIQIDTLEEHRGKGYARRLLSNIREGEKQPIHVVSTSHAVGFYKKIGYTQVAPFIFQSN